MTSITRSDKARCPSQRCRGRRRRVGSISRLTASTSTGRSGASRIAGPSGSRARLAASVSASFDPEAIAAGEADWWWNPLSYVTSDRRALELTDAFVGAYRDPDARPDPFFDPAGQELVSHLLRAAALDGRPVTQTLLWATRPNDDEPARILRTTAWTWRRRRCSIMCTRRLSSAAASTAPPVRSCR